jgi:PAS domain S-box-containing protein
MATPRDGRGRRRSAPDGDAEATRERASRESARGRARNGQQARGQARDGDPTRGDDELLRDLVEVTDEVVALLDSDGRCVRLNPAARRALGGAAREWKGRSLFDLFHGDDREHAHESFAIWIAGGAREPLAIVSRLVHADGAARHTSWTFEPPRPSGKDAPRPSGKDPPRPSGKHAVRVLARARTVSEPGDAPESKHDARLRGIMSSILDAVVSIDTQGKILAANDAVRRVFGYAPSELVGRKINLLMPEPHRTLHDEYLASYRETHRTWIIGRTRDFDVVRKDGTTITCALSVWRATIAGESSEVLTGIFRDVTVQRRAEAALRASEVRFHAIFDQAYQYLGLLTPEGKLIEANQAALDACGVKREDVIGANFWETRWWSVSKETQERLKAAIESAAQGEFVRFETEHRGIGDAIIDVDFSLKPVKDDAGRVVLLIPEGRDITAIKRAQRAETQMLRALASIGESAAVLAHEIKNPITALNLALRAVADQLGEDQRVIVEDLVARMRRLEQLMRRTLSFAKPLDLARERIDVRRLFDATLSALRPMAAAQSADVAVDRVEDGIAFVGDAHLMEEVLTNLVTNALEAKSGARVRLSAGVEANGRVLLAVDDDGPGIAPSLRSVLFNPFTTSKSQGNGLGLAICKKIVEAHGGAIAVEESRLGGARFAIRMEAQR